MKVLFLALGMAVVLFIYGYIFSTVGHDHAGHGVEIEEPQAHDHSHH